MKKYIIIISVFLASVSCELKWELPSSADPVIVVEGWIETGKPATVILTNLLPFTAEGTSEEEFDLEQLPLKWATVKLSDGENEEMLVGMYDKNYVPPYVYKGSEIFGEEGRTYILTVKYPGVEVTAQSTMPSKVTIDRAEIVRNPSNGKEYNVKIHFTDDSETKDYYKVFTKIEEKDTRFYPSFMGNMDDGLFHDGKGSVVVNRAFKHVRLDFDDYTPFFLSEETVRVKLAHLPEEGYEFWESYENEITGGSNVLFPRNTNLKTNIHGGRGIWCAYAVDMVDVSIR